MKMKKMLLVTVCLASATLFAQSVFEGTWRVSQQSGEFGGKPETFSLQQGVYRCDSCVPKIEVKADGEYHKVTALRIMTPSLPERSTTTPSS